MSALSCLLPPNDIFLEGIDLNIGRFNNANLFEEWVYKLVNN